jgi:hypothetical protein
MKLNAINARLLVENTRNNVARARGTNLKFITNTLDGIAMREENCLRWL